MKILLRSIMFSGACALALVTSAISAQAQSSCGDDPSGWFAVHSASMDGFWAAESISFLMNGEDMGSQSSDAVSVTALPDGLLIEGFDGDFPITLSLTDRSFDLDPPAGVTQFTGSDLLIVMGCDNVNDMPRLFSQETMTFDGQSAEVTFAAVVPAADTIYLWFHMGSAYGELVQLWHLSGG